MKGVWSWNDQRSFAEIMIWNINMIELAITRKIDVFQSVFIDCISTRWDRCWSWQCTNHVGRRQEFTCGIRVSTRWGTQPHISAWGRSSRDNLESPKCYPWTVRHIVHHGRSSTTNLSEPKSASSLIYIRQRWRNWRCDRRRLPREHCIWRQGKRRT